MYISISGVGYAGAGAYYDLLCEYKDIEHTPNLFELGILYEPDGVIDLVNKLKLNNCKVTSYVPVRRFLHLASFYNDFEWFKPYTNKFLYNLAYNFIQSLAPIKVKGEELFDLSNASTIDKFKRKVNLILLRRINAILKTSYHLNTEKVMLLCLDVDDIENKAKKFVCSMLDNFRNDRQKKILIKHICPPDKPSVCLPYLPDDFKHISVNRDPRDLYIWGKLNKTSSFPCKSVLDFIRFYKSIRMNQTKDNRILYVNFEDLCYKYEETKALVESFIGESANNRTCKIFDASVSIKNTQLFNMYTQYKNEIETIEEELSEYLYIYSNYK